MMEAKHPIRVVARRTGLTTHLIRMWERRYRAVSPMRTGTKRRLYSDADIERLSLLRQATQAGESISQMAGLTNEELRRLLIKEDLTVATQSPSPVSEGGADRHLEQILDALRQFNVNKIEDRLLTASVTLGQQLFLEKILQPLMHQIGEWWSRGEIKIAHEHLTSSVIRSLLGNMLVSGQTDADAPLILATTPSGQMHELGVLMAAVTAESQGWRVMYLGPNLPAEEIALVAKQQQARAVLLSLVYPSDDPRTHMELQKLARLLGDNISILIGGQAVGAFTEAIKNTGAIVCKDLNELKVKLNELRQKNSAGYVVN